jgi:hypothetical protein
MKTGEFDELNLLISLIHQFSRVLGILEPVGGFVWYVPMRRRARAIGRIKFDSFER